MSATKLGFQIESSLASKHLTDAEFIKGGYLAVETIAERDALPISTADSDGIITAGSVCYIKALDKFYVYNNSAWKIVSIGVPECPTTTDGTFVLQAVVSGGVVTYNWIEDTVLRTTETAVSEK